MFPGLVVFTVLEKPSPAETSPHSAQGRTLENLEGREKKRTGGMRKVKAHGVEETAFVKTVWPFEKLQAKLNSTTRRMEEGKDKPKTGKCDTIGSHMQHESKNEKSKQKLVWKILSKRGWTKRESQSQAAQGDKKVTILINS